MERTKKKRKKKEKEGQTCAMLSSYVHKHLDFPCTSVSLYAVDRQWIDQNFATVIDKYPSHMHIAVLISKQIRKR